MKFPIDYHLAAPGLALAASISLIATPNVTARFMGAFGTSIATGYGLATFLQRERETQLRQSIGRTKITLDEDRARFERCSESYKGDMQFKLDKAVAALEAVRLDKDRNEQKYQTEIEALKAKYTQELITVSADKDKALAIASQHKAELNAKVDEFAEREAQFYTVEDDLISQVETFQALRRQEINRQREEWSLEVNNCNGKWAQNYRELQSEAANYGEVVGMVKQEALNEVQQKDLKISELTGKVDELRKLNHSLVYSRFDTVGADNIWGNRLIDALATQNCTYGAYHHDREGYHGKLKVWLKPIDASIEKAQKFAEDLQSAIGGGGLYAKPTVKVDRRFHLFTLTTEKEHKEEQPLSANLERLKASVEKANHIRLVGASGSGKSTFLDNLIWLGRLVWPTANFQLLDPKAPFTEWTGGLVPDYKNLDCVEAIQSISVELQDRFYRANKMADVYGNESPEFKSFVEQLPYELFVLDEAQYLYRDAKAADKKEKPVGQRANTVRDSLLDCLGVGRALKVKGYFITQSAKCSKIGMNEDDFDNAMSIFLGGAITNALEGELKGSYSKAKIDVVTAEYRLRKSKKSKEKQYIGLVSDVDCDDLYLIKLPKGGFFHNAFLAAKSQNSEICSSTDAVDTKGIEGQNEESEQIENPLLSAPESVPDLPKGICPKCSVTSVRTKGTKANSLGKRIFYCDNVSCSKKTFSAKPIN